MALTIAARALPVLALLHLASGSARAGDPEPRDYDAAAEERSEFWERVLEPDRDEYLAKLDHARELLTEGDSRSLELAENALQEASRLVPDDPRGHFWLGRVHYRRAHHLSSEMQPGSAIEKEWAGCARAMSEAHRIDAAFRPDQRSPAWTLDHELARCYAGAGKYEGALDHLERILTRGFTDVARVHFLLGEVYMGLGRLEDAITSFENALRLKSPHDPEINFALAIAYDRAEIFARSREHLEAALRREPGLNSLWAHGKTYVPPEDEDYYLGLAYEAKGELAWAIYHFRRYLASSDRSPWERRARSHLEEAKEYEPGSDLVIKGTAKVDRQRAAAVVARADEALQSCVESTPNLLLQVRVHRYAGGSEEDPGRARRGRLRVIPQGTFGPAAEEKQAARDCVDRVASSLELPTPSGSGGTYASFEFMVIAR